ncbi:MAG: hypothetical protein A2Y12_16480 [Planctomycetes bacterium GWF2_42_9]|nr:MAG: hypothetical protein A2Y12_16480 [Planctomycetes bacterium GWF2_42_9]
MVGNFVEILKVYYAIAYGIGLSAVKVEPIAVFEPFFSGNLHIIEIDLTIASEVGGWTGVGGASAAGVRAGGEWIDGVDIEAEYASSHIDDDIIIRC